MTKITVGIPAYRTRFLTEAISSVLTQTFTDFELLISDDSPDGAVGDLVSRIRDPRIRLIQGPRRGLVANSAHIWENASSPFLKYVYDDDRIYPSAVETLLGLIERDERFLFAFSHRDVIDEYGRVIRRPQHFDAETWLWFEGRALAEFVVSNIVNPVGEPTAMLIRRSAFPDGSALREFAGFEIRHLIDVAFVLNAAGLGRAVATPERLCAFRQHREQVSSDRAAPAYPAGLFEWEILVRGAVQSGLAPPNAALLGLQPLDALYRRLGHGFEEIAGFRAGLPRLGDQLGAGQTAVIDADFRERIARAERLIRDRAARPSTERAPPPLSGENRTRLTLDLVTRRRAKGWAWAPESPETSLRVEALCEGRVIGQAVANMERADLRGIGTGRYGFDLSYQETIQGEELPSFRVILDAEEFTPGDHKFAPLEVEPKAIGEGGAEVLRQHARFTTAGPDFEAFQPDILAGKPKAAPSAEPLLVAFYLSQFHPIPENDRNWGAGFTEWRQLARGAPRFPGHYQPRIPRDLGFYNLLDPDVLPRQVELAQAAGLGAFGFYYYWFDRRRVLERPIEQFLGSATEMPFFLIWANENWTRAWDGGASDVLLQQNYHQHDEDALLEDLGRHMVDRRHVRIDGRPLFVIYNAGDIPETEKTLERWRRKWESRFGLQPLIFMAQTFHREDPRPYGLDGALEFPPHKLAARTRPMEVLGAYSADFTGDVMAYDEIVSASLSEPPQLFPLIKTAVPAWDNDARRPGRGMTLTGSSPQKYQAWLQALLERAIERPVLGRPIVAINAWNEWAEGAYLEPDVHYGSAYLNATARALRDVLDRNA